MNPAWPFSKESQKEVNSELDERNRFGSFFYLSSNPGSVPVVKFLNLCLGLSLLVCKGEVRVLPHNYCEEKSQ